MNQDNQQIKQMVADAYSSGDLALQNKVKELLESIKSLGFATDKLVEFLEVRLTEDAMIALTTEVYSKFQDEDLQNLERAFNTGLNEVQQRTLVLELYKQKTGRDLEEFAADLYQEMSERVIKDLSKHLYIMNKVSTYTDEQADELIQMVKDGRYEEAITKFENAETTASSSDKKAGLSDDDVKTVISLLNEGKVEEAKRLLNQ